MIDVTSKAMRAVSTRAGTSGSPCVVWLLVLALGGRADAQQELAPGQVLRLEFPELPPTYQAMHAPSAEPTAISVRLPDDYEPGRAFPLFVFLECGYGGSGGNLGVPLRVAGPKGYVAANFPLFRKALEDPGDASGISIGFDDFETIRNAHTAFLERLRATIPNLDPTRSVLGGHSNGAKTIAILLSALDEDTLASFRGFFLIDGGFEWTSYGRTKRLENHHILYLVGGGAADPPWWREHVVARVKYFRLCAERYGMTRWSFRIMEGRGHEFPPAYHPILREWLAGVGE